MLPRLEANTPNAMVMDLCKLKPPFFAKDTTQVNKLHQMQRHPCDLKTAVFEVVVRMSNSRPMRYNPLGKYVICQRVNLLDNGSLLVLKGGEMGLCALWLVTELSRKRGSYEYVIAC